MGNWSSTSKASPASTVDASAFNEEKAPNQANRAATAVVDQQSTASVVASVAAVEQPKPKVNPSNNGGMRPLDALK